MLMYFYCEKLLVGFCPISPNPISPKPTPNPNQNPNPNRNRHCRLIPIRPIPIRPSTFGKWDWAKWKDTTSGQGAED